MNRPVVVLTAVSILFAGAIATYADHTNQSKTKSANEIIGKKVMNSQNEDLGKIQDLIINVESGTAPYAVIATGGTLGINRSKVAVPLSSLQCSADGKNLVLSASKAQLQSAATNATGRWAEVADAEWARQVDAFYSQPTMATRVNREGVAYDREGESRTFVREPTAKGDAQLLMTQDSALCEKICENVDDLVHVRVQNGVTHLYGRVESEEARRNLENRIRAVPGVTTVESHVKVGK